MKVKLMLKYALIGGPLGYFVMYPFVMIASHAMFEATIDYTHPVTEILFIEIPLAFSTKMLLWGLSFAAFGTLIGYLYGKVKQEERELREANATKDKFFSILAHDLKNPFNVLLVLLNLLRNNYDTLDEEEKKRYIRKSYDASERLHNLLEDLLEWSRMQRRDMQGNPEKITIAALASETISLFKANAEKKNITLRLDIRDDATVYADVRMVMMIFRNLVSNAIKFTQAGGEVRITSKNGNQFETITISDTGIGISEENIPKLFRIDIPHSTPGTAQEQGTGLGLALCKEFIEQHGGKIWVKSEVGRGSHVTFTLPRIGVFSQKNS